MPIRPENKGLYPPDWKHIRAGILTRAGHRCESSPGFPTCQAANHQPHPETGSQVVLTIAHLDHGLTHNEPADLRAWCLRCHVTFDARHHGSTAARTKKDKLEKAGQLKLF